MKTPLQHLEEFAGAPNSKFVCRKSGRSETTNPEFVASVSHILNPAASSADLKKLRSALGVHVSQFEEVYSVRDGFILYKDRLSEATGIEALPISAWKAAAEELQEWFEYLS